LAFVCVWGNTKEDYQLIQADTRFTSHDLRSFSFCHADETENEHQLFFSRGICDHFLTREFFHLFMKQQLVNTIFNNLDITLKPLFVFYSIAGFHMTSLKFELQNY